MNELWFYILEFPSHWFLPVQSREITGYTPTQQRNQLSQKHIEIFTPPPPKSQQAIRRNAAAAFTQAYLRDTHLKYAQNTTQETRFRATPPIHAATVKQGLRGDGGRGQGLTEHLMRVTSHFPDCSKTQWSCHSSTAAKFGSGGARCEFLPGTRATSLGQRPTVGRTQHKRQAVPATRKSSDT